MFKKNITKSICVTALLLASLPIRSQTPQEWSDSLARLNSELSRQPSSVDLRLRKAAVNIELSQWEYAADEYGRVLELEHDNLAALYYRAYANTHLRRYDMAKYDYERFLSIVPKHFEAQYGLAMVKRKLGRQVDTMDELNRLVQLFPDSALAYAARAGYEAELRQYDVALYDWDEAIRLSPANVEFQVSKLDVLLAQKNYDEAWLLIEQLIRQGVPRAALKEWIDRCK
jgi:tetratricopeptide (TPR) repeat protein